RSGRQGSRVESGRRRRSFAAVKLVLAVLRAQVIDLRLQRRLVGFQPIDFCLHHRDALELHAEIDAILFDLLTNSLTRASHPAPRPLDFVKFTFQVVHPCEQSLQLSAEYSDGRIWMNRLPMRARQTIAV